MSKLKDKLREWFDCIVVALSVAMCFRAYFFEPFNIPTGSMQPTLWGNYAVEGGKFKGAWDVPVLSILKWLWTGEKFAEYKAPASGIVGAMPRNDGFADMFVGNAYAGFKLPAEAAQGLLGRRVRKGETIWRGNVVTGDFILVNRWKWNFWKPKSGEVVVFSTTGIGRSESGECPGADGARYAVQQGIHFIKRLKATPGETYQLEHPVPNRPTEVTMGEDEYFACGDNFNNSNDSRYWGPVPGTHLLGTGSVVFWPFSRWRAIK